MSFLSSLAERRVLVTGATGFIGSWLTEALLERGSNVTALVKLDERLGLGGISKIKSNRLRIVYGDIRNTDQVKEAVRDQEIICHLAAVTQVLHAINDPGEAIYVNVNGTLNMLEAARKSNVEFFVFAGTDKEYGEPKYLPIDESHPISSKSPYDASKVAADQLAQAYHLTYGLPLARSRWSNAIGGRDSNILRAVPNFITSLLYENRIIIRGNGTQIRDYMYVSDSVAGMLAMIVNKNISNGEVFNLGTEKPTSVLDLANLVIEMMGMQGKIQPTILGTHTPGEIDKQYLSAKKAHDKLGWVPKIELKEAVRRTILWYKENPDWYDLMVAIANSYKDK